MLQYEKVYLYISYEPLFKCRNVLIAAKGLKYAGIGPLSSCVSLVESINAQQFAKAAPLAWIESANCCNL